LKWFSRTICQNQDLRWALETVVFNFDSKSDFENVEEDQITPPKDLEVPRFNPEGRAFFENVVFSPDEDWRNDPEHDNNAWIRKQRVPNSKQMEGWYSLVRTKPPIPAFGPFASVARQQRGASFVFTLTKQKNGTKKIEGPFVSAVKDGRAMISRKDDLRDLPEDVGKIFRDSKLRINEFAEAVKEKGKKIIPDGDHLRFSRIDVHAPTC